MAAEQHGDEVAIEQLPPQPVVSIRATAQVAQLGEAMGQRVEELTAYLRQSGAQPTGPFFVRYHTFGEIETDMETGFPVAAPVLGEGPVFGGGLPGGPAITTWHHGPHPQLGDAYARLTDWLEAHGRAPAGPTWEIYHWIDPRRPDDSPDGNDPATWGIQLVQPFE